MLRQTTPLHGNRCQISLRGGALALPCASARSRSLVQIAAAQFKGAEPGPLDPPVRVVGMGSVCMDYLAAVAAYPQPDDKLRTEQLELQGGGNCGNALTAAARLGLSPAIVTKLGGDAMGDSMVAELQADGVDTAHVLRQPGAPSPFTYIIVDRAGGTRTCIHTPGAAYSKEDMSTHLAREVLQGASLVYFDGRLTEAALVLARAAREAGVPVLVEAERLRPSLEELLQEADYVVTSEHFPQDWTGERCLGDALHTCLIRLPRAKWLVTTLGKRGAVAIERVPAEGQQQEEGDPGGSGKPVVLQELLAQLLAQLQDHANAGQQQQQGPDCVSSTGVQIRAGGYAGFGGEPLTLARQEGYSDAAREAARCAAERAAAANAAAPGEAGAYLSSDVENGVIAEAGGVEQPQQQQQQQQQGPVARVGVVAAAALPQDAVVDTTGAGDAFIGSVVFGLATGMTLRDSARLAALVAACKCTQLGPRPGLPRREQLAPHMLLRKANAETLSP